MYSFQAEVWVFDGPGGWHFVSLPERDADDIEERHGHRAGGFGSVPVEVTIGATRWRTSLFPDRRRRTYVLPVKKSVRTAEGFAAGATVTVALDVLD